MIRGVVGDDLLQINAIYDQCIVDSHVSFDLEPWTLQRRRDWFAALQGPYLAVVAEAGGEVVGFASSGPYRHKEAYRGTVETTIALDRGAVGRGLGTQLYGALLDRLAQRGVHRAVAIVSLPNPRSMALHHKLGYRTVGVLDQVGFKLGRFWSTALLQRSVAQAPDLEGRCGS